MLRQCGSSLVIPMPWPAMSFERIRFQDQSLGKLGDLDMTLKPQLCAGASNKAITVSSSSPNSVSYKV